jgi:hypothetical protein
MWLGLAEGHCTILVTSPHDRYGDTSGRLLYPTLCLHKTPVLQHPNQHKCRVTTDRPVTSLKLHALFEEVIGRIGADETKRNETKRVKVGCSIEDPATYWYVDIPRNIAPTVSKDLPVFFYYFFLGGGVINGGAAYRISNVSSVTSSRMCESCIMILTKVPFFQFSQALFYYGVAFDNNSFQYLRL